MMIKRLWQRFKAWRRNRNRLYVYLVAVDKPTYTAADDLTFEIEWYESENNNE